MTTQEQHLWTQIDALPADLHASVEITAWPPTGWWSARLTFRTGFAAGGATQFHEFEAAGPDRAAALAEILAQAESLIAEYRSRQSQQLHADLDARTNAGEPCGPIGMLEISDWQGDTSAPLHYTGAGDWALCGIATAVDPLALDWTASSAYPETITCPECRRLMPAVPTDPAMVTGYV